MSLYDMDDQFFPQRAHRRLAEGEMTRGMDAPPPLPDPRHVDHLFVMVNLEEVPLSVADLVRVVEMHDGLRPLIAFALPLNVHNGVFGADCPERTAPSRLVLLQPQALRANRPDTQRRFQVS